MVAFEELTGHEVLSFMTQIIHCEPAVLFDTLSIVSHYKDRKVSAMSGGQRKLLAVCVGLLKQPKFLLLDEPTTGLDSPSSLMLSMVLSRVFFLNL